MEGQQNLGAALRQLPRDIQHLVEKKLELWALKVSASIAESASAAVSKIAGVFLLLTGLFFLLFGTAFLLNELLQSTWAGFMVQGGFFAVMGLLFMSWKNAIWRKKIRGAVFNSLITSFQIGGRKKLPAQKSSTTTPA